MATWYLHSSKNRGKTTKRGPFSLHEGLSKRSKAFARLRGQGFTQSTADHAVWGKGDQRAEVRLQDENGNSY